MALTNSQYEAIQKKYERRRDVHRSLGRSRQEEVYAAIPEFQQLAESVSTLSVASARRMLEGDDDALDVLHRQLTEIASRQKQLLIQNGFPADYLDPDYDCPDCRDTGYILTEDGICLLYTSDAADD